MSEKYCTYERVTEGFASFNKEIWKQSKYDLAVQIRNQESFKDNHRLRLRKAWNIQIYGIESA